MERTIKRVQGRRINPVHGGDLAGYRDVYGRDPMDFSANISPLGLPEKVKEVWTAALPEAEHYPDPFCRQLCRQLSRAKSVPEEWILCGSGAADLIFRIGWGLRPKQTLLAEPGFAEYRTAMEQAGCRIRSHFLQEKNDFRLDGSFLSKITEAVDLVFLCEPNNPTGLTTDPELLQRILERCRQTGTVLVADECFNAFLDEPEAHSLKKYLADFPNLILLKAFTKIYAMAGLRVGFLLCSDRKMLERIGTCGQPWPVSGPAQAAACAALSDTDYVKKVRDLVHGERERMSKELTKNGCRVIPGEANFLLFQGPVTLAETLEQQGILIRDCSNFPGLEKGWFRTAIRTPEENDRLLGAIADCRII